MPDSVQSIIAEHLDVSEDALTPTTLLAELGASSYDLVTLVVRFEEEYDISINEDEIRQLRTVQDVEDMLSRAK